MLSHTNFFYPYERIPAWHENQLTRALLVVLRYSPFAHQAWLDLISPHDNLHRLPEPEFSTQSRRVLSRDHASADRETIRGLSVWLAPDDATFERSVDASEREQVLDGIVVYGNDLVVVIENKIVASQSPHQAQHINVHGSPVAFSTKPVALTWKQILDLFSDIVGRDLASRAERAVISDLLEFVEEHFPNLGPYSTLIRCGNNAFRIRRRLDAVQEEATGCADGKALGWRDIKGTQKIAMAFLGLTPDSKEVSLQMYLADTLGQARAFYSDPHSVAEVLALRANGWAIASNFHWGFMAPGYAWMRSPLTIEEYVAYWLKWIKSTREVERQDWESYWSQLLRDRVVDAAEKWRFDEEFSATQRQRANPRPGIGCEFRWPIAEAAEMDGKDQFVGTVRLRINEVLSAIKAPPTG